MKESVALVEKLRAANMVWDQENNVKVSKENIYLRLPHEQIYLK